MADYHPLIARAVAGLEKNTGENRRALYERARTALVAQLRGVAPALDESEITRERLALEEAIRKVEAESARHAREARGRRSIQRAEHPRRETPPRREEPPPRPASPRPSRRRRAPSRHRRAGRRSRAAARAARRAPVATKPSAVAAAPPATAAARRRADEPAAQRPAGAAARCRTRR